MASETTPHSTAPHTPHTEPADPNSSSSTLVNHATASPHVQDAPSSPFSASFDPNPPTPMRALRDTPLYPIREGRLPTGAAAAGTTEEANAPWAHRLSMSFGAIANQIAAASQALATVPPPTSNSNSNLNSTVEVAALAGRLDVIERAQEQLGADLREVQTQLARVQMSAQGGGSAGGGGHAEKEVGEVTVVEVHEREHEHEHEGASEFKSGMEIAIEELQKKVDGAIDTIKLDQARLYARLHNAMVTTNKMLIKAPMMANGKLPLNFPNTKGEFEHLTKERYEHLLQSYNLPIKGDTSAKREALREFIGLTPAV